MNKFINKILKEAEDYSDNFFQSKHVNKRNKEFMRSREGKMYHKLENGFKRVKIAYNNREWSIEKEKEMLRMLSERHVDSVLVDDEPHYVGFWILNDRDMLSFFYDIVDNELYLPARMIRSYEAHDLHYFYHEIESILKNIFLNYFKLKIKVLTF